MTIITDVEDLHTARTLSAAGVEAITLRQDHPHFTEIKSWVEGVQVGAQITNAELSIPSADFLIVSDQKYFLLEHHHKPVYCITALNTLFDPKNENEKISMITASEWFQNQD